MLAMNDILSAKEDIVKDKMHAFKPRMPCKKAPKKIKQQV